MIVTSFTLRSPCSWKLQCEMYVLQFYLNLFSVVLAQLRLTLRCRCIDASTSTHPHLSTFRSSHAHLRRSTSPPHHTHTSAHLYHICTSTLSLLHICPVFLSFYISFLSSLCTYIFARSHPQYTSTSISHLHIHTVTPSHPPSLSLFLYIFSTVLDNYMSRSRANRRLVKKLKRNLPQKTRIRSSSGISFILVSCLHLRSDWDSRCLFFQLTSGGGRPVASCG